MDTGGVIEFHSCCIELLQQEIARQLGYASSITGSNSTAAAAKMDDTKSATMSSSPGNKMRRTAS